MNEPFWRDGRPAGFWIRLLAMLVDFFVFVVVGLSLNLIARRAWGPGADDSAAVHFLVSLFSLFFSAVYATVLHAVGGQTLGKALVRVRVVADDGEPLPLGASLLRYLSYGVSVLPIGLGFVMAGLRRDKRALHDLIAGSRVLRVPPRAPASIGYSELTASSRLV